MAGIEAFMEKRSSEGLLRVLRPVSWRSGGKIYIGKKEYIDFSSNDYLGLSGHPRMIEAAKAAMVKLGTSSCASRLLSGDSDMHHQLEEAVATFKNKESALVFNSGYQANIGIISALYGKKDCVFSDRFNHASIVDGISLSGAHSFRFQHNNIKHLETLLEKERGKFDEAAIITETVFSMDGDKPDLKELVRLKNKYKCSIMVDEAHATGIFGKNGSGLVEQEGLEKEIDLIMGTFSKALGSFGAYLATSKKITEYLINASRGFIYSTALPPAIIACNLESLRLVQDEPSRRGKLLESAEYFRDCLKQQGFEVRGDSQIVPLIIKDNLEAVEFAKRLQEKGYWVLPVRPPTVPIGQARLRFSLSFNHSRRILERITNDISGIRI
jgi:8-amino-7-oxononanoate synthase